MRMRTDWLLSFAFSIAVALGDSSVLEGVVEVYTAENFTSGAWHEFALLRIGAADSRDTVALTFGSDGRVPEHVATGSWVRAVVSRARAQAPDAPVATQRGAVAVESIDVRGAGGDHAPGGGSGRKRAAPVSVAAAGHRRTAVLVATFKDIGTANCNVEKSAQQMWDAGENQTVAGEYRQFSHGNMQFVRDSQGTGVPDVFGPYLIAVDPTKGCAADDWGDMLEDAATTAGVDLSRYQHRMFFIPATELCSWEGLGTVGCGVACRTWIPRCDKMQVMVHELGHNLGLRHSASRIDEGAVYVEYGDLTSVMGNAWWSTDAPMDFVAAHMEQLGWIPPEKVLTISAPGVYSVAPLNKRPEATGSLPMMAKIRHQDTSVYYYFSYRIGNIVPLTYKMLAHVLRSFSSACEFANSFGPGEPFKDIGERFSVLPLSITDSAMIVNVTYGCTPSPPAISALDTFHTGQACPLVDGDVILAPLGTPRNVTFTVRNPNSALCLPSHYALTVSSPSPSLNFSAGSMTLTLWPQLSCNVTVTVTASLTGEFPMTLALSDNGSYTGQANMSLRAVSSVSCTRPRPSVEFVDPGAALSPRVGGPNSSIALRVTSRDSPKCIPSPIVVTHARRDCPAGASIVLNATSISIAPGKSFDVLITAVADSSVVPGTSCEVIVYSQSDIAVQTTIIPVKFLASCTGMSLPNFTVAPSLNVAARQTMYASVVLQDPFLENCTFSVFAAFAGQPTLHVLDEQVEIRNGVGATRVLATARDSVLASETSVQVSISSGQVSSVTLTTTAAECVRASLYTQWYCDLYTEGAPGAAPKFTCDIYISNLDSWSCQPTTFTMTPINTTGFSGKFDFPSVSLFPSNWTWVQLTVTQGDNETLEGEVPFTSGISGSTKDPRHTVVVSFPVHVGRCKPGRPTVVSLGLDFATVFVGQTAAYSVRLANWDNDYCLSSSFSLVLDPVPPDVIVRFSPGTTLNVPSNWFRDFTLYLTPTTAGELQYNFTLIARSTTNASVTSPDLSFELTVDDTCEFRAPSVAVLQNTTTPLGRASNFSMVILIKNQDVGQSCPASSFLVTFTKPQAFSGQILQGSSLDLAPNATAAMDLQMTVRENAPPGNYAVSFYVTADFGVVHSAVRAGYNIIPCPVPEAPHAITSQQTTPTFGTKPQVILSWTACISSAACCCPCTYNVFRDGKFVGSTTDHKLTDTNPLTEGVAYSYEVVTVDSRGVRSPNDTCRNFAVITGQPADLTTFLILLISVLVVVITLITCATIVAVYWKWPVIGPKVRKLRATIQKLLHRFRPSQEAEISTPAEKEVVEMDSGAEQHGVP